MATTYTRIQEKASPLKARMKKTITKKGDNAPPSVVDQDTGTAEILSLLGGHPEDKPMEPDTTLSPSRHSARLVSHGANSPSHTSTSTASALPSLTSIPSTVAGE
jgi:hypothetical protein